MADNIDIIVKLPKPKNTKEVEDFMGHYEYYRRFIYMYTVIAKPLNKLLVKFEWIEGCDQSIEKLSKI